MANHSNFRLVNEGRSDRRVRKKHGHRGLEMRSMSCPEEDSGYSEMILDKPIRKVNSHGHKAENRRRRSSTDRNSWKISEDSPDMSTNSSPSVYNEMSNNRSNRPKISSKKRNSKYANEEKRNSCENGISDTYLGQTDNSFKENSPRNSNGDVDEYKHSRKERRSRSSTETGQNGVQRHTSKQSKRSSRNSNSKPTTSDNDIEKGQTSLNGSRNSRNSRPKSTSHAYPDMHQYTTDGEYYTKPMSRKTRTGIPKCCSKGKLVSILIFILVILIATLVLAAHFSGFFEELADSTKFDNEDVHNTQTTTISIVSPPSVISTFTSSSQSSVSSSSNMSSEDKPTSGAKQTTGIRKATHFTSSKVNNRLDATTHVNNLTKDGDNVMDHMLFGMDFTTSSEVHVGAISNSRSVPMLSSSSSGIVGVQGPSSLMTANEGERSHEDKERDALGKPIFAPDIHVLGMENISPGMPATFTCTISNLDDRTLTQIIILHHASKTNIATFNTNDQSYICMETSVEQVNISSCLEWKSAQSLQVTSEFDVFACTVSGRYDCIAVSETADRESSFGYMNFTEKSTVPTLSVPKDLIDSKEPTDPITCSANLGSPHGIMEWHMKRKGHSHYMKFDGFAITSSGECGQEVTASLYYTPIIEANGTLLKCVVKNGLLSPPAELVAVEEIQIVPKNLCTNVPEGKTTSHPFICTKYIKCVDNEYVVMECRNNMCFDEKNGVCGQKQLSMTSVVAYLNEGPTSIKCHLTHVGNWQNITISKQLSKGGSFKVISVSKGLTDVNIHDSVLKDRVHAHVDTSKQYEVDVNMWIYGRTCGDEGTYVCGANTDLNIPDATGTIRLLVKPAAPTLSLPNDIVDGHLPSHPFICEANVGYPHGEVHILMKMTNETDFHAVPFNITLEEENKNCSASVKKTFRFVPGLEHNGMKLRCEVSNNVALPPGFSLVDEKIIHVVPGNFCTVHTIDDTLHVHPYDCQQYVQCTKSATHVTKCGGKFCFNPESQMCDMPLEEVILPFDPHHPCAPDKNGLFFAHPVLCNKFLWCVQGQEVVRNCSLGTLYLDGGHCTYEPKLSKCYKETKLDLT